MNMSTDKQLRPNGNDEGISEGRRRMLRAAATAAPLVATLPSGAVLANASAFQCLAKDKAATDRGEFSFVYAPDGTTLLTVPAQVQTQTKTEDGTETSATVYRFPVNDNGTPVTPTYYYRYLNNDLSRPLDATTDPVNDSTGEYADYGFNNDEWMDVEVVRVFGLVEDTGGGYISVKNCGSDPCVLLAKDPNTSGDLTALNDSCMTSLGIEDPG